MRSLRWIARLGTVACATLLTSCHVEEASTEAESPGLSDGGSSDSEDDGATFPPPFTTTIFDAVRIESQSDLPNFQRAETEIDFPEGPFEKVTLVVDLGTTCFPFESWSDNPPPEGENWPADCDAFDRNFNLTLDDPVDSSHDAPALELMHAITPFGGPLHLEIDVTDVVNGLPGKHRARVAIPTWSDAAGKVTGSRGGWNVTARLDFSPGPAPRKVLAVVPIFHGEHGAGFIAEDIPFTVPEGTTSSRLEYRTSGHGGGAAEKGCIGPAEEFCKRKHTIFIDGQAHTELTPWRKDCKELCTIVHYGPEDGGFDYCAENPCGLIESVRAPRANWCPGDMTEPYSWDIDALRRPGEHVFRWDISKVAEGGLFYVSATYFAFGD